jgi:hypothetical protein
LGDKEHPQGKMLIEEFNPNVKILECVYLKKRRPSSVLEAWV